MKTSVSDTAYQFRHWLANDLAKAEPILKKHPELINQAVYGDSESALHFFSVENRSDVITWLIARGANPNGIASDSFPLHEAAQLGNIEICRLLVEAGADPNLQDFVGETSLHKAASHAYVEIIELLLDFEADPTIRGMCDELPIDQSPPRKRAKVQAAFDQHAIPTNKKKHNKPAHATPRKPSDQI
jgi:ankyrin repeat protein